MEQKSNGPTNLSWREAIIAVLKLTSKPMSATDIVDAIKEHGMRTVTGNTPEATVGAQIYTSIKRDGDSSPFIQTHPNEFALKQSGQAVSDVPPSEGGTVSTGDEEEPKKTPGVIRAFGMFWRRDFVEWKSSPRILGRPSEKSGVAVDFCNQRGVYFLHDGSQLVYVGRAVERPLGTRLFEHTIDRLNGRWDRFSWFGLLNLSDDGKVNGQGLKAISANGIDIVVTMEALLIEGLEPKQNRKRGDVAMRDAEYIQSEDPNIQEKKMREVILSKLLAGNDKLIK
jgi:HB1, ASXL, restriction endonuclease HTH domain